MKTFSKNADSTYPRRSVALIPTNIYNQKNYKSGDSTAGV